ncbi:MAG: B12-binding domain-containing radical SAM protein [Candidatus Omnitrophica bacterium]|nr:B12-binding domain-containing radical SAM protein [Candidatus Omnitrophota bacterium]MBU1869942.1 B12-binding domain-containing radical SAM protein [Candidatus Omnitrophota bacterium]
MGLKILLVELPIDSWNRYARRYLPNPGTLALATYLKSKSCDVKLIDTYAEGIGWKKLAKFIRKEDPDIIGSSSYTPDIYGRILLARITKKINPSIVTVLGGCHVTLVPEETLRLAKAIDYAVLGEGEETFFELVQALGNSVSSKDMGNIRGIAYLNDDTLIKTEPRPFIKNLDSLPMPDYSLIPMARYTNSYYFPYPANQGFSATFSRGCPEKCNFCAESAFWQSSWRGRSAKAVVEELKVLNKKYGKRFFLFYDDNFMFNRQRNIEFIEEMRKSGLKIEYRIGARVDTLLRDRALLKDLRSVGLTALQIGVESFDQDVLNGMHKNYNVEKMKELSHSLKEAGIPFPMLFFVIGNYNDNRKTLLDITRKSKKYGFNAIQVTSLTPWPGTHFFEEVDNRGLIQVKDYRLYDFKNAIMPTKYLTTQKVDFWRFYLFFKWYSDIGVFLSNMKNRYLRHYHLYSVSILLLNIFCYRFIHFFKIWNLFWYNRLIDRIHKEHAEYIKLAKSQK